MLLAFFHVPVYPEHRKYLSFLWNGRMYQFQVLCFGVKNAPFAFVKLGEAVRNFMFLKVLSSSFSKFNDDVSQAYYDAVSQGFMMLFLSLRV